MREAAAGNAVALSRLRTEILDRRPWEEPILFACERASRADQAGINAVAAAVREALTIYPMLAAEMIYRSASDVWELIEITCWLSPAAGTGRARSIAQCAS